MFAAHALTHQHSCRGMQVLCCVWFSLSEPNSNASGEAPPLLVLVHGPPQVRTIAQETCRCSTCTML
jgi:hypothetical protein